MSDNPQPQDTPPQASPPAGDDEHAPTLDELARRQEHTDHKLDELLALVKGSSQPAAGRDDTDIPRLVAEGVEKIEADKKAKADAEAKTKAGEDRLQAIEKRLEARPKEPTGKVRGWAQRNVLGRRD